MGSLGDSAQEPLVSKAFIKVAQVNKQEDFMPHINIRGSPIKQSVNLYYS